MITFLRNMFVIFNDFVQYESFNYETYYSISWHLAKKVHEILVFSLAEIHIIVNARSQLLVIILCGASARHLKGTFVGDCLYMR